MSIFKLNVLPRTVLALVLISTAPVICAAFLGLIPLDNSDQINERVRTSRALAVSAQRATRNNDYLLFENQIEKLENTNTEIVSARLIRFDGLKLVEIGDHNSHWELQQEAKSNESNIRVGITRQGRNWATLELAFKKLNWYEDNQIVFAAIMGLVVLLNLLSFGLFLKKTMSVLSPGKAVPRRVRNTLDTIVGGVVVLDSQARVLLSNESFLANCKLSQDALVGKTLDQFKWRYFEENTEAPWLFVLREKKRAAKCKVELQTEDEQFVFVVNATPIMNSEDKMAGVLVSFEDVTEMEHQRVALLETMDNLEISKEKIRKQNETLLELAMKDPLTGAFNRRAFFEKLENQWAESIVSDSPFSVVMLDIDHFKSLNDTHGHAAGDAVLKDFVKTVSAVLNDHEMLGRYGGEEFCVIIPGADGPQSLERAEKIRQTIEIELADPYRVTASVGTASRSPTTTTEQQLLGLADNALYFSKKNGRNRATLWNPEVDEFLENEVDEATQLTLSKVAKEDQPVPYNGVVSLHAALAYRHTDTAVHSQRVAEMSVNVGRGLMSVNDLYILEVGALLHDVGKIGVPDHVLLKPGRLTDDEWQSMELHGEIGVNICEAAFNCRELTDILEFHHCRYDGKGQPAELPSGENIPLAARIVCIVDAYDAMVSDRVYRKGRSQEEAFAELQRCAGTQFDAMLVERFIEIMSRANERQHVECQEVTSKVAVAFGNHLERAIHAFELADREELEHRLKLLENHAAEEGLSDMTKTIHTALALLENANHEEWSDLAPMIQDIIEIGLTIQRAYLKNVGGHGDNTVDSADQNYLVGQLRKAAAEKSPNE